MKDTKGREEAERGDTEENREGKAGRMIKETKMMIGVSVNRCNTGAGRVGG